MERVYKIKTREEYAARKMEYDLRSARWSGQVVDNRIDDAGQKELKWINKEYAAIREFEKANQIYRYPAFKVGKTTYQVI